MIINVTKPFLTYSGKEVKTPEGEPFTTRDLIDRVLNTPLNGEVLTGEEKSRIHKLNLSLYENEEVFFSNKDAGYILERSGKSPYVTAQMYGVLEEILDPKGEDTAKNVNQ